MLALVYYFDQDYLNLSIDQIPMALQTKLDLTFGKIE